ncbi:TIGR02678 family protein [Nocardia sp. BMG111209]|uniref:TIGR02678 family protein n=1 Tax=Nocardia sp. BMG111209 TaxID=1160137 RepID=UPI000561EC78|nr:TIGR02678 family protein [Nocardia sp. BMG111209]
MGGTRDEVDLRRAFVGLLANPVVDRRRDPELFGLVRHPRHRVELSNWFSSRLGYRLVVTDTGARLFRLPLGDTVIAPRRVEMPPRRALVLALLAAAAAEEAEEITTTQDLSDRVRVLSGRDDAELTEYDPDRFAERKLFATAVKLLLSTGALAPVDAGGDEQRDGWTRRTDQVGGTYEIRREMLLRMVDPAALAAALGTRGPVISEGAERFSVMRRLLELPVCLYRDLTEAERAYLIRQRSRIVAWCTEMTGWTVEQRAEGLALIATEESDTDLPFPRLRAVDFVSLMVLDELYRRRDDADVVGEADLTAAVAEVSVRHPKSITADITADAARRERVLDLLRALDLIRPGPKAGEWQLTPIVARYRDPRVVAVTARLEDTQ